MNIFKEEAIWESMWPIVDFKRTYGREDGVCKYVMLADGTGQPDSTALMVVRMFIQKETKANKYVMGTRFYSFGDLATLDIISLDFPFHREIIAEHTKRFGWASPVVNADIYHSIPFAFVGGFIEPKLVFVGSSGDYGDNFFGWSSNDVVNSAVAMIRGESNAPDKFFEFMLTFMKQHKLQRDFYEKLYQGLLDHLPDKKLHPQHLGSLVTMKALDRALVDGTDFIQALVEETTDGLGRVIFLANVVKGMEK